MLRASPEQKNARQLDTVSPPMTVAPSQSPTVLCYKKIKTVEINRTSKSDKHPPIELRELQIYTGGINIAQQGSAYQSSTYQGAWQADGWLSDFGPSKAIDGDTSTYSSTSIEDNYNPYWGVNLDSAYSVENITILHGSCGNETCLCGLSNYSLFVEDVSGNWESMPFVDTCNESVIVETFDSCA
jgi:hypothetical protein